MANKDLNNERRIGNYRLIALIDKGAFGSVYKGQHIIFKQWPLVAVKLLDAIPRSQQEQEEFIEEFKKEANVLQMLNHPHILRILDAGFEDELPYLATEYADGGSLQDRLRELNGKPFPLDEAIRILTQVGQALQYAHEYSHEKRIVHRDLKPKNILFNTSGDALLADFGMAVILDTLRTLEVGTGGTPRYMAPEQFKGDVSVKSDQYALGCIAYELVTGHQLFDIPEPTPQAYLYHHLQVEPKPPTHYQPDLPAHVEKAILTALAKDRTKRYSDILAFVKALSKSSKEWGEEGFGHYNAKQYEEAIAAFDQAIQLDPNDPIIHLSKGNALIKLKRYEEALAVYDQALRLDPNNAGACKNKGYTLFFLKRYEEALTTYEQAIRLDPTIADTYNGKGHTLKSLKRYEEALTVFEQALHLNPSSVLAVVAKGDILYALDRYEKALAAYNQALALEPENTSALRGRDEVLKTWQDKSKQVEKSSHASQSQSLVVSLFIDTIFIFIQVAEFFGASIVLSLLLHSWWILGGAFLGGIIFNFVIGTSIKQIEFIIASLFGIIWSSVGWFLTPLISPIVHIIHLSPLLPAAIFLLVSWVTNYFLTKKWNSYQL